MILCLVEPGELSLEALAFAQRLGPVHAFSVEAGEAYAPGAWAAAIVQLVEKHSPDAVVAAASDRGQEAMAHAAARLDLALAANCVSAQQVNSRASRGKSCASAGAAACSKRRRSQAG